MTGMALKMFILSLMISFWVGFDSIEKCTKLFTFIEQYLRCGIDEKSKGYVFVKFFMFFWSFSWNENAITRTFVAWEDFKERTLFN